MTRRRTAALVALVAVVGCTKPKTFDAPTATKTQTDSADPWQTLAAELKKTHDPAAGRRALAQLNSDLVKTPAAPGPDAGAKKLIASKALTDDEAKDLLAPTYTGVDGQYITDCLYLRDVARSLDVAGRSPVEQAAAAFDWTCRQVYLRPITQSKMPAAVPPTAVLRRGSGLGLERAGVFLALAQQLGLDAVLIGPPGLEQAPVPVVKPDGTPAPRGPFWAVGVVVGKDTFLFDPWQGEPVTVPTEPGIATLAKFQASLARQRTPMSPQVSPWEVSWDALERSVPYVVVPLPAAAPRMKPLEDKLAATFPGLHLFVDADAVAKRVGGPIWLPPAAGPGTTDPVTQLAYATAYPRATAAFVVVADGGQDAQGRRSDTVRAESIPQELVTALNAFRSTDLRQMVFAQLLPRYSAAFIESGVREKMHRGQLNEAVNQLVGKEREFGQMQERLRTDPAADARIADWTTKANAVYEDLARKRALPETRGTAAEREAEDAIKAFWQAEVGGTVTVIDKALATVGQAEAGYLLALCLHEKAVRAQSQADRDPATKAAAVEAWNIAADAWNRFLATAEAGGSGRLEQAKKLAAAAKK